MVRAATLCIGDWVFHTPSGKPIQIDRETLLVAGKFVIGYDFEPIMLTEEFFVKNGFTPTPGDSGSGYRYTEKDKVDNPLPAYVDWWHSPAREDAQEEYHVAIHGNGCTVSFDRNIAVHELQAALRVCKIFKRVEV